VLKIENQKKQGCDWLAKRGGVLQKHPKACLRVPFLNSSGIRETKQPCASLALFFVWLV
jgi:hypothetical protein